MKRELLITTDPIDEGRLVQSRTMSPAMGAAIYFSGVVRDAEEKTSIAAIDYECFHKMAEHQFHLLFDAIEKKWPIEAVRLIHRVGLVRVNEASLWLEVIAPHRGEAFAAAQWLIDEMKRTVPIWKKPIVR